MKMFKGLSVLGVLGLSFAGVSQAAPVVVNGDLYLSATVTCAASVSHTGYSGFTPQDPAILTATLKSTASDINGDFGSVVISGSASFMVTSSCGSLITVVAPTLTDSNSSILSDGNRIPLKAQNADYDAAAGLGGSSPLGVADNSISRRQIVAFLDQVQTINFSSEAVAPSATTPAHAYSSASPLVGVATIAVSAQ